jgi:hypothetical protein
MMGRSIGLRGSVKVFIRKELVEIKKRSNSDPQIVTVVRTEANGQQVAAPKTVTFSRGVSGSCRPHVSHQLSLAGKLLHLLLDFPLFSGENNKDYVSDRAELFQLLRSFAEGNGTNPVHLLLYPEGWCLNDGSHVDRKAVLAMSNEFAKREGRPQLRYLLLPRTTGFNASLESLRASSPVVYDVTMVRKIYSIVPHVCFFVNYVFQASMSPFCNQQAYVGYDGSVPPSLDLSLPTLWRILRKQFPSEIHIRIKRYSMEEVLQDSNWLDKQWTDKDKALGYFIRHQSFPMDSRGFCRHLVFDTRQHSMESSALALIRLLLLPCAIPLLLFISIPLFWIVLWCWLAFKSFNLVFSGDGQPAGLSTHGGNSTSQTPGSAGLDSATGTPFFPATPFVSPSVTNWRDMIGNHDFENGDSPVRR